MIDHGNRHAIGVRGGHYCIHFLIDGVVGGDSLRYRGGDRCDHKKGEKLPIQEQWEILMSRLDAMFATGGKRVDAWLE
jgi:hypothetical protein